MFSRRTAWDRTENRLARALSEARAAGASLVDLTESNPTTVGLYDTSRLIAELGDPRGTRYEPMPLGHPEAKKAIAQYYARRGLSVDESEIVVSASTSEAYAWLFSLLADADDVILAPRPSYPLFAWIAAQQRIFLHSYPLQRDAGFRIDVIELKKAITERTRAITLVHPNNPTGSFTRRDEAATLFELAAQHDLALIVDEVFGDYAFERLPPDVLPSFVEPAGTPLVFVLSGLSKVMLLPQCKLSWMVVRGPRDLVREAIARLELIADTYLSVATPIQLALPMLLERQPEVESAVRARLSTNLSALDRAIAALGPEAAVRRLPCLGGWYAILEVPRVRDEDEWVEMLVREDGIIVHPGYFFELDRDGFLVMSLLLEPPRFAEAVQRLVRRLAE